MKKSGNIGKGALKREKVSKPKFGNSSGKTGFDVDQNEHLFGSTESPIPVIESQDVSIKSYI